MRAAIGLVLVGLAIAASETRVFTDGADIVTAIALVLFLALSAQRRRAPSYGNRAGEIDTPAAVSITSVALWASLVAVAIGFELFNYAESPRHAHPTVSSALAVIATHSWSRGLAFFSYLALGIWIATT